MNRVVGCLLVMAFIIIGAPAHADLPTIRVAVLKFGTVNWLMQTIQKNELDRAEGVDLEIVPLASGAATRVAFLAGDSDALVVDWVWAMRQRAKGRKLRFSPYSKALGALVAGPSIENVCALDGKRVGVVGGELDKGWLILQALADRKCGYDLAERTETLFGAPPLMSRQLQDGAVDAVSTYWHFVAKLEATGMKPVKRIDDALADLGISPAPAMIGFVWDADKSDGAAISGFLRAIERGGALLATDDQAWDALRPLMRAASDAEFEGLRAAYRAGIPGPWTDADTESARRLHELLSKGAGEAFTSKAGPFDPAVFAAD